MIRKGIGHNELYKMGFDGAGIGTLRGLTKEQRIRLLEILDEQDTRDTSETRGVASTVEVENKQRTD